MPRLFALALITFLCTAPSWTQTPPAIPTDPKQLMLYASQVNGLDSLLLKPWHLKASYQTFDPDGNPKDAGIFEEWWAGPRKYKISYTGKIFNQIEYRDDNKDLVIGNTGSVPSQERMVPVLLLNPMPSPTEIGTQKYEDKNSNVGQVKLKCLWLQTPNGYTAAYTFCLDSQVPALRVKAVAGLLEFFNNIVKAGGQYVAKQIVVQNGQRHFLNVDVTALEFVPGMQDALFTAPPGAFAAPAQPPSIPAGIMAGNRISGDNPKYPAIAKAAHVQGVVVLDAVITKDGAVDELHIVSGPPMLQQAAYDAVKTWKYKPYLLNGQAIQIKTQVNIVYTLGNVRMQ